MAFGRKGHICFLNPTVTVNVCDATTSHVQENKRANTHPKHLGSLHKRRVSSTGRWGRAALGNKQERPAALETAPEGWGPRSAEHGRRGAPGAQTPRGLEKGPSPDPYPWTARLHLHCSLGQRPALSSPAPQIPQHRSPLPAARDPNPDPTATAPSPGRGGGHQAGGQRRWQRRLRAARSRGRAAAGPRPVRRGSGHRAASGQRLRPAQTKRPRRAGRGVG